MNRSGPYPRLTKSYQGKFPFKIGTTSFIYPDHYIPNVKMLGPFMDEIELLLFESAQFEILFSKPVVEELLRLSNEHNLSFNVHLPTDVSISHRERILQQQAVDTLVSVIGQIAPLNPTTLALHIPYDEDSFKTDRLSRWRDRVQRNLEKMLEAGIKGDVIAVETLDYPFEIIADIVDALNLSICMDLGHLINHGTELVEMFEACRDKIRIIHLHGVENRCDHRALDRLPGQFIEPVFSIMKKFSGSVSLEVFSYADLTTSLEFFETCWNKTA